MLTSQRPSALRLLGFQVLLLIPEKSLLSTHALELPVSGLTLRRLSLEFMTTTREESHNQNIGLAVEISLSSLPSQRITRVRFPGTVW